MQSVMSRGAAAIDAMGLGATLDAESTRRRALARAIRKPPLFALADSPRAAQIGKRGWFAQRRRARRAARALRRGAAADNDEISSAVAEETEEDGASAAALPPPRLPDPEVLTAATRRSPLARIAPDRVCFVTMLACISGRDFAALALCSRFWRARGEEKELANPLWQYYHYHEFVQRMFAEEAIKYAAAGGGRGVPGLIRSLRHRQAAKPRSIWEYLQRSAAAEQQRRLAAAEEEAAAATAAALVPPGTREEASARSESNPNDAGGARSRWLALRLATVRSGGALEMVATTTSEPALGHGVDRKGRYRRAYRRKIRKRYHSRVGPALAAKVKGERSCRGMCRATYLCAVIGANHLLGGALSLCLLALAPVCFVAQLVARDSYGVTDADPLGRGAWIWLVFIWIPTLLWALIFVLFYANRLASFCCFYCHWSRFDEADAYVPSFSNAPIAVAIDSALGVDRSSGMNGDKGAQPVPMIFDSLLWGAPDFNFDASESSDCDPLRAVVKSRAMNVARYLAPPRD